MNNMQLATFGGGCFWCVETLMRRLKGVETVISGYTGGNAPGKPTYREVCSGLTGHAEVVQVKFDADVISYKELLQIFMTSHDPTTLNRQGGDVGTQYRSCIFYHDAQQKETAQEVLKEMQQVYDDAVTTTLEELTIFYDAEEYHQDYFNNNGEQSYCQAVISPKLAKFRKMYADKLKEE
ncbi:peptide-methionine (S)-S-oxide reductase [Lishizhenia tianjinensis]|uniref:Peptide methionine sulfoxide reductase MsrA n=1 Tax=Lishizhenia tianjinensis TaxID=477690 RepID=A0A1I7APU8_9FLAO|nr:peptide-methionine (S)-S-oxide reductase MsrA [Lishizhenia tianjinensis]SFT76916.1 peptide-methionine (S)-S-oxide reductase [Lishizhenia tianjinensis]